MPQLPKAAAYADAEPEAGTAAARTEERLRTLHPYAMAWYDRLRAQGAGRFDAMGEAVPLFGRAPHARPGDPAPHRRHLASSASPQTAAQAVQAPENPGQPGPDAAPVTAQEQRGWQIVARLQARAAAERGSALNPDELATVLGATTTLSPDMITRLARGDNHERTPTGAEPQRAVDLDRAASAPAGEDGERAGYVQQAGQDKPAADAAPAGAADEKNAAHLAAESFPCTVSDAVRAAVRPEERAGTSQPLTTRNARRSGPS